MGEKYLSLAKSSPSRENPRVAGPLEPLEKPVSVVLVKNTPYEGRRTTAGVHRLKASVVLFSHSDTCHGVVTHVINTVTTGSLCKRASGFGEIEVYERVIVYIGGTLL